MSDIRPSPQWGPSGPLSGGTHVAGVGASENTLPLSMQFRWTGSWDAPPAAALWPPALDDRGARWPRGVLAVVARRWPRSSSVARNTVVSVYDQLVDRGLYRRGGPARGPTVVDLPERSAEVKHAPRSRRPRRMSARGQLMLEQPSHHGAPGQLTFHPGMPDAAELSVQHLEPAAGAPGQGGATRPVRQLYDRRLSGLAGGDRRLPQGRARRPLPARADRHHHRRAGRRSTCWRGCCSTPATPPGWRSPATTAHRRRSCRRGAVGAAARREGGLDARAAAERRRALIYVTPACQHPLGDTMRMEQRLEAARARRALRCLRHRGRFRRRVSLLRPSDPGDAGRRPLDRVIYVGTFAKLLFPALRLGFMVLPGSLAQAHRAGRSASPGQFAPLLLQAALADFISRAI